MFDIAGINVRGNTNELIYTSKSAVLKCPKTPDAKNSMDKVSHINTPMRDVHGQIDTTKTDCLGVEKEIECPSSLCSEKTEDGDTPEFGTLDDEYVINAIEQLKYLLPHVISQLTLKAPRKNASENVVC